MVEIMPCRLKMTRYLLFIYFEIWELGEFWTFEIFHVAAGRRWLLLFCPHIKRMEQRNVFTTMNHGLCTSFIRPNKFPFCCLWTLAAWNEIPGLLCSSAQEQWCRWSERRGVLWCLLATSRSPSALDTLSPWHLVFISLLGPDRLFLAWEKEGRRNYSNLLKEHSSVFLLTFSFTVSTDWKER